MNNPLIGDSNETNNNNIKELIQTFIKNKNRSLQETNDSMTKEINSLKTQEQSGNYFIPLTTEPTFTTKYIGLAIISILGDIIDGIGEATNQIKEKVVELKNTQDATMRGGADDDNVDANTVNADTDPQKIESMADNLSKLIVEAKGIISNIEDTLNTKIPSNSYSSSNLLGYGLNEANKIGKMAINTGIQTSERIINYIIDFVLDFTGNNNLADKTWQELSPELNKKLILFAAVLKELSENPATKEAIKEIAKVVAVSVVEWMKEIKPDVDMITDQTITMLKEIANKSVHGATSTSISVLQAFLAEIPFVGGILDLTIAIGKGFNALMKVFNVFVSRFSPIGIKGAETIVNTADKLGALKSKIEDETDKISQMVKEQRAVTPSQQGGQYMKRNNGRYRSGIMKSNKRIHKTMKLFHATLPRMKYRADCKNNTIDDPSSAVYQRKTRRKKT